MSNNNHNTFNPWWREAGSLINRTIAIPARGAELTFLGLDNAVKVAERNVPEFFATVDAAVSAFNIAPRAMASSAIGRKISKEEWLDDEKRYALIEEAMMPNFDEE